MKGGDKMTTTEAQKKATLKYDTENTVQVKLKLNVNTDADIIRRLDQTDNKQGYIKRLIRKDMAK